MIESLYRRYVAQGMTKEAAFLNSAESITGPRFDYLLTQVAYVVCAELRPSVDIAVS